jgi:PAS domain S-box-containing protein
MSDKRSLDEVTAAWQQARDAYAKSEQRYRDLVDHSLGLICTHDLTGRIDSINPAAAHSLGYEPEHGVGHNLAEFLAPETRHLFDDYLRRIRENGHDAGLMRVVARDGNERVWMYRNVLFHEPGGEPYVLGHAIDITERVVAERALREKEHELERRVHERTAALQDARDALAFLASASEGLSPILRFDGLLEAIRSLPVPYAADWTMTHVVDDEGVIQSQAGAHLDPGRSDALSRLAAKANGPVRADSTIANAIASGLLIVDSDGSATLGARWFPSAPTNDALALMLEVGIGSVAVVPLTAHGHKAALTLGAAANDRFTGSHHTIVEELARRSRLAMDRIQLYREAQDANRLKDEFLSTLSHELRTPLNAVYGWARILRRRDLDEKTAHGISVIERNAEAQMRLIDDVLDVSRIITGKMTLTMEPVDVGAVLRAAIDVVRPALQAKHVRLQAQFDNDVPPLIGDAHRLQQVFWNVLSNAVKFTNADGVVRVTLLKRGDAVQVRIADTGVGIRRDVLPFVFDRFRQADSSMTRTHGGLGLGLAIVRHVVELHGGTVHADSAGETHGATFTIDLPVDEPGLMPAASAPVRDAVEKPRPSLRGRRVLVVEDHDDARELVASALAAAGAEVICAASTPEALDQLAATVPDVLLADLGLPGEDGYTLLRRVRAMPSFDAASLPAIALTAYARASDRDRAFAAGFVQYVVKPVDPEELVRVIASVVRNAPH